jgi:4-amino-4-deoxy-L-arabinose transferase-like glycosyltransferase
VLNLIRKHRIFFLGTAVAGLALRLLFFAYFPTVTDDSRVYIDLATNWLQHGIYGHTQLIQHVSHIVPSDTRLPGYPAFLAVIFWLFGLGNVNAALLTQILIDLATCLIVADLARRVVSERTARVAFVLAAACPFLANYAAAALTETLEIFFTALALDCAVAAFGRTGWKLWAATGVAIAACILIRPDGGILLAAVVLYLVAVSPVAVASKVRGALVGAIILAVFALAPLIPWTIRNFRTLHHFQPLAPRYANETDELAPRGFNRWAKTWIVDYASVEEIYWNVPGDKIDPEKLPSRVMDSDSQTGRDATLALIADYNQAQELTPGLDARFGDLAADRIRAHPFRYYVGLPLLRIADMWLRPRTEILPPDVRWWEFNDDGKQSALAVGLGLLNLIYVGAAVWTVIRRHSEIRWVGLFVCFVLLRTAFLGTLENPEPRYTLECYPVIILLASTCVGTGRIPATTEKQMGNA